MPLDMADGKREVLVATASAVHSRLPAVLSESDLGAARLASLFVLAQAVRDDYPALNESLHSLLLDVTVRRAVTNCPYYQRAFSDLLPRDARITLDEFQRLPLLSRSEVDKAGVELRSRAHAYGFSTFTSGTTSQHPVIIDRSHEEAAFISDYCSAIWRPQPGAPRKLALRLVNSWHGKGLDFPGAYEKIDVGQNGVSGFRTARDLLLRTYSSAEPLRISALIGPLPSLLRLTAFLQHDGCRAALPRIERIESGAEYMTRRSRQLLEDFWQCEVQDRFGTTESVLATWRCPRCKAYHFEPWGHPEVLALTSDKVIASGSGRLVLTTYYPWAQLTPFIRYISGDIVEFSSTPCPTGLIGIIPHGRLSRSIIDGDDLVLSCFQMIDALDDEPAVARSHGFPWLPPYLKSVGFDPSFSSAGLVDGCPTVEVNVLFDPGQFPRQAAELESRISAKLSAVSSRPCRVTLSNHEVPII